MLSSCCCFKILALSIFLLFAYTYFISIHFFSTKCISGNDVINRGRILKTSEVDFMISSTPDNLAKRIRFVSDSHLFMFLLKVIQRQSMIWNQK